MSALFLDDVQPHQRAAVGGKAFTLARLKQAGLPVPDGFVIGADDGRQDEASLVAAYEHLGGGSVAVRSSARSEDLADASFAGQYLTRLDVRGAPALAQAAAECAASVQAVGGYADAVGATTDGAMAVLVQHFVEPRLAGVVFTRDPRDPEHMRIEAHAGRGEELVSGRVRPETHVVRRSDQGLVEAQGTQLDAGTRAALVELCLRVETLLGAPQDVEWALGEAGLVLLQARPITVEHDGLPHPGARRLTRANVGEVLPDPVTPLTWTSVCDYLQHGFAEVTARAGLSPPPSDGPFLVLHHSRLYLNLSLFASVSARLPAISPEDAERLILGSGGARRAAPAFRLRDLPSYARIAARLLGLARWLPHGVAAAADLVAALPSPEAVASWSSPQLAAAFDELLGVGRHVATAHIATSGAAGFRLALLGRVVERLGLATPNDVVNRLVGGLDGVASVSPTLALESLAAQARVRPEWRSALEREASTVAEALRARRLPADLQAQLEAFFERYGHRGVSEAELRAASWRQDPTPVCGALRALMDAPRPAGFGHASRASVRDADTQALLARLAPVRRRLVAAVLTSAQHWVAERERTKSLAVEVVDRFRRAVHVAARHLVDAQALRAADDVFFLTLPELVAALEQRTRPAQALVARRRRRFMREGALPAPRFVDLDAQHVQAPDDARLHGIGVSPGIGVGRARIVTAAASATLQPGEILVTPVLDAALGPLLAQSAGAVTEIGGLLSHGSVVARELGVPCVVDVPDVTRRVKEGQRLWIDGSAGLVRLLEEPRDDDPEGPASHALRQVDPGAEGLHTLERHALARESVYFNVQDHASGLVLVASLGRRGTGRGEALVALRQGNGPMLFGLTLERATASEHALAVGGYEAGWGPVRLRVRARLRAFDAIRFPLAPLRILTRRRSLEVDLDLSFTPKSPAVDFCDGLDPDALAALEPLGSHHIEQSGTWDGELAIAGSRFQIAGTGSRDQSWGRRDWSAADYWRLFTLRLGDDVVLHALCVGVRGRRVEGGFLWRDGRLSAVTRVEHTAEYGATGLQAFDLVASTADGPPLVVRGQVVRRVTVPVELQRRPLRHLFGRPWALVLHEHFTRYEGVGRTGFGMAEFTERR